MADKTKEVGIRLSVKDKDTAERAMKDFGRDGEDAMKRIARAGDEPTVSLKALNAAVVMTKAGIVGLLTGLTAGGVLGLVSQVRDAADGVVDLAAEARRAGVDFESFQELKFAAEQNKVGVDALTDGLKELNLRADEFIVTGGGSAAEAFKRLGYNASDLNEKLKNPSALFTEIIGKLERFDQAAQIRILDELFGGTGGEQFVQFIELGEEGLQRSIDRSRELGTVLSNDVLTKANELNDAFNTVTATVSSGLQQAIVNASWALYDFLQQFWDVQERTKGSLEAEFTRLGAERPDNERKIFELADKARVADEYDPAAAQNFRDAIAVLEARQAELTAREKVLLEELNRRAPTQPTVSTAPIVTVPGSGASSSGKSSADREAEKERKAIERVTEALQFELAVMGQSDGEKRVMNELRRAGVDAASSEGQTIRGLVKEIMASKEAYEQVETAIENVGSVTRDVFGGILSDIRANKDEAEILGNVFDRLAEKGLDMALDWSVSGLTKGLTSLFAGGGSSLTSLIPGLSGLKLNARGDTYSHPSLSAYSNQVHTTPQTFLFARGAGMFAEDTPEAILPLIRDSLGNLGVRSSGGGQTVVKHETHIINNGGVEVESGPVQQTSGGTRQDIQINRAVARAISTPGPANRAVRGVGRLVRR